MDEMLVHKALEFAAKKHRDQLRKGTDTPYIVHPVEVMLLLTQNGCHDDCIVAGLLHDTLEDTCTTREELAESFGEHIASLVSSESEDKSKSWQERKQATIDRLRGESEEVKLVCLADKLSNLRSMLYDYDRIGEDLWARFNADKAHIARYYCGVINATKGVNNPMRESLIDAYVSLFGTDERIER